VPRPTYELTAHAKTVIEARGISLEWLERVLANPERTEADVADPELRHAIGRIAEHGDRRLRVVYNGVVTPWRVITAYFDRALRGRQ
jgi:hypothetical protein